MGKNNYCYYCTNFHNLFIYKTQEKNYFDDEDEDYYDTDEENNDPYRMNIDSYNPYNENLSPEKESDYSEDTEMSKRQRDIKEQREEDINNNFIF